VNRIIERLPYRFRNIKSELRGAGVMLGVKIANSLGVAAGYGELSVQVFGPDGKLKKDYGVVGRRVVTTAGVNAIRDQFLGTFTLANFKFHEMGTGSVAEAVGDTLLGTPVETRSTGTQVSGGTGAYQSVATITATAGRAITEHGLFSVITANTITLFDRTVFSVINLLTGDSIQFTMTETFSAGG
jgi:hypothetical protein